VNLPPTNILEEVDDEDCGGMEERTRESNFGQQNYSSCLLIFKIFRQRSFLSHSFDDDSDNDDTGVYSFGRQAAML
jgi:hypothetical protein